MIYYDSLAIKNKRQTINDKQLTIYASFTIKNNMILRLFASRDIITFSKHQQPSFLPRLSSDQAAFPFFWSKKEAKRPKPPNKAFLETLSHESHLGTKDLSIFTTHANIITR